jgi:hypothetical protein
MDYGHNRPNVHTMPTTYHTKSAQFSEVYSSDYLTLNIKYVTYF